MGTSILNTPYRMPTQDHPHAYGDKIHYFINIDILKGSSPRVWGQVVTAKEASILAGIIPTRMGTSRGHG